MSSVIVASQMRCVSMCGLIQVRVPRDATVGPVGQPAATTVASGGPWAGWVPPRVRRGLKLAAALRADAQRAAGLVSERAAAPVAWPQCLPVQLLRCVRVSQDAAQHLRQRLGAAHRVEVVACLRLDEHLTGPVASRNQLDAVELDHALGAQCEVPDLRIADLTVQVRLHLTAQGVDRLPRAAGGCLGLVVAWYRRDLRLACCDDRAAVAVAFGSRPSDRQST